MKEINLSLKEQIHKKILYDIIQGEYGTNDILNEKKLMEKYSVSRAPVREALIQLCSENVLQNLPKRGYTITSLSDEDLQQIIQYRISLECGFLRRFGSKIDNTFISELQNLYEKHQLEEKSSSNALAHWENNMEFHLLLFNSYGNRYAYTRLEECLITQTRYYVQKRNTLWQNPSFYDVDGLHFAILDYLTKANYNMAANLLKADIEDTNWIDY